MKKEKLVPELRFPEFEEEWEKKRLGDILDFKNGLNKGKKFFGKGTPIVNYMDVNKNKHLLKKDIEGLVSVNDSEKERFKVIKGDTFFTRTSETVEEIGLASVIIEDIEDCVYSGFILRGRKIIENIDMIFSGYLYNSEGVRKEIMRKSSKTTRALTNGTLLSEVELKIPYLDEQEKIGNFFYKVDKKIELQEELIENLENQKKGIMQKIFNQEIRFKDENGEDYPEWEEKQIKDIGTLLTSSVNKKIEKEETIVNLYNYMDVYNKKTIDKSILDLLDKTSATKHQIKTNNLLKGDILITPSSETPEDIGHSVVIWEDLPNTLYSYHLLRFRPNIKMDLNFSNYWFNNENVRKKIIIKSQGATRFTISIKNLENVIVKYPSKKEQEKIGNFLSTLDSKIEKEKKKKEKLREKKKGLMQRMFI